MNQLLMSVLAAGLASLVPLSMTRAAPAADGPVCAAKVIKSEEVAYAPQGSWLARVTLHVVPRNGPDFVTTVEQTIPWQKSAPRFGEIYWLRCDPAESRLYY